MGVRNLLSALRKKHPQLFLTHRGRVRSLLRGKHIAIDAANHICRIAHRDQTIDADAISTSLTEWVRQLRVVYDVHQVFLVCDATKPSVQIKSWEAQRRSAAKRKDHQSLKRKRTNLQQMESKLRLSPGGAAALDAPSFGSGGGGADDVALMLDSPPAVESDGAAAEEAEARRQQQQKRAQEIHTLRHNIKKHESRIHIRVTKQDMVHIAHKSAAQQRGVVVVEAPTEGEFACAALVAHGMASVVVSNDSDVVPMGVPMTLRFPPGRPPELLCVPDVLRALNVTQHQLRAMCVLAGTDFSPYIRNLGVWKAHKLIQKHTTLLSVLNALPNKAPTSHYPVPCPQPTGEWLDAHTPCRASGKSFSDRRPLIKCPYSGVVMVDDEQVWSAHVSAHFAAIVTEHMVYADKLLEAPMQPPGFRLADNVATL